MKLLSAEQLHDLPNGQRVRACGIVTVRQQPQTANGTIFVTLEDETGPVNVIVWKSRARSSSATQLLKSRLLAVRGVWQRDVDSGGQVRHLVAAPPEGPDGLARPARPAIGQRAAIFTRSAFSPA